jgi:hypothetical protein
MGWTGAELSQSPTIASLIHVDAERCPFDHPDQGIAVRMDSPVSVGRRYLRRCVAEMRWFWIRSAGAGNYG